MGTRVKRAAVGAASIAALALMVGTVPAGADPATGKVEGGDTEGYQVNVGRNNNPTAKLIGFKLSDGTKLKMYCVEINTNIDDEHEMVEAPWDKYPNPASPFRKNHAKINWVLHNGYPVVGLDALAKTLAAKGKTVNGDLSAQEAITATQAAAWHFSDETTLDKNDPVPGQDKKTGADVLALYEYLTGSDNVGMGKAPTPALDITPKSAKGEAGALVGPFTVATTGDITELKKTAPAGVKVTDKTGTELAADKIKNGTEIFFSVPKEAKAGEASFALTASAQVATGRLFVGKNYKPGHETQSLIVAQSEKSTLTAGAKATWTAATVTQPTTTTTPPTTTTSPAPQARNTGGLASTGASILVPVVLGLVLLAGGAGALLFLRRRRGA